MSDFFVHPTSEVSSAARIGPGTRIWNWAQVREGAVIGAEVTIGQMTYVGVGAVVGDRCRVMHKVVIDTGVEIEEDVFVGPYVLFTNDNVPRAWSTRDLRGARWRVGRGASLGGHAVVLPDCEIGHHALVGCNSVVTRHIPPHAKVVGSPARVVVWVCRQGHPMQLVEQSAAGRIFRCAVTGEPIRLLG